MSSIMRLMDIMLAFPSLLLAIVIVAILGPSLVNAMVAVTVVYLPRYVRWRAPRRSANSRKDYVTATRVAGVGRCG